MTKASGAPAPAGALLTRDQILAAKDIATKTVEVPEWGGSVLVRGLSGSARDTIESTYTSADGTLDRERFGNFRAAIVSMSIVDESGARVFTDADVAAIGEKSSLALGRVFDEAMRLSALRPEDGDGIYEDLKDDPSDGTGSD